MHDSRYIVCGRLPWSTESGLMAPSFSQAPGWVKSDYSILDCGRRNRIIGRMTNKFISLHPQ